ncbi:MAG TPA: ClpXP protease specificity-enhancing factor SspB [Caulobacteraceae bacterium]|nr:ClpXP protease specificity-enhancing factor SspB [Caulobacteraceae bacterium]
MAKDERPKDLMRYEALQQDALRGVVRAALKRAASPQGLPGEHHFYISFRTEAPGVSGPKELLAKYPDEMTIVLQNQFWDLAPGETFFSVTLKFGGQPKSLSIPYAAVTRFYDPSVQYLLQFTPPEEPPVVVPAPAPKADRPAAEKPKAVDGGPDAPKVVSLDQFRKK